MCYLNENSKNFNRSFAEEKKINCSIAKARFQSLYTLKKKKNGIHQNVQS